MSHIHGEGHGSCHNWKGGETGPGRVTPYWCVDCGASFGHAYPAIPNIFEAMARAGVPNECVQPEQKQE